MASFEKTDKRTHYCTDLSAADIGKRVNVLGWCQRQRDLGSLIFIDIRDRTGILQLAFDEKTDREIFDMAFGVRAEYVLAASGIVRSRGEGAINHSMKTGEIEVAVDRFKILSVAETPPFEIVEDSNVNQELRLKHRYLDLRRPELQRNVIARSKISKLARDYFEKQGFIDIETPTLIKPTPEARETTSCRAACTRASSTLSRSRRSSTSSCLCIRVSTDTSRSRAAGATRT